MRTNLSENARRDGMLVLATRCGDEKAFEQIIDCYSSAINFMILKMVNKKETAKELTDETFEKAFINLHQYQFQYAFSSWLFRIAHNHAIDHLRRKAIVDSYMLDLVDDIRSFESQLIGIISRSTNENPEEILIRKENEILIRKVLENLEPRCRKLLELRYFGEYSYSEIASELKISIGTIKVQLFRSRKLLHQLLRNSEIGYC